MMKANFSRIVLLALFFGLLLFMWGLDLSGVRRHSDIEHRANRVLPDLMETPETEIRRVAIDRGGEHLVFERRGKGLSRWQMVEPKNVAAEPVRLDALVRTLKELRKDPDAGVVKGDPASYGLAPPSATVRLYAGAAESASADRPIAELEFGKTARGRRYIRPGGGTDIEVADARLLNAVDQPIADWRQPNVMGIPTFQVKSVRISRPDQTGPQKLILAERGTSGHWTVKLPVQSAVDGSKDGLIEVPANGPKVESLLGALSSLRVAEPPRGYVADDVKDDAPFGLDPPRIRVELKTDQSDDPILLDIGKTVPEEPERVYARQGGQDDVVMVEARAISEIPTEATALRSQQVTDIVPAAVTQIEVITRSDIFKLEKAHGVWQLISPRKEKADAPTVQGFLSHLEQLQTSEFLDSTKVPDLMLDPPVMTVRIRQTTTRRPAANSTDADSSLALVLRLGRHDILKKSVFARIEGDGEILALPDVLLDVLPKNPLAFRDRAVVTDSPASIKKLIIRRGARIDELVPDSKGAPNAWRMLRPVEAPADAPTITQVLTILCSLRAQDFAAPDPRDLKDSGLDQPVMQIDWDSEGQHWLKIGAALPRSANFYAMTDAQPMVFTIPATTVRLLDAEYHDHRVMSFPPARARRVVLSFWGRTVALRYRTPEKRGQIEWVPEPGSDIEGIDLSRIGSLVQTLSQLQTLRFIQYEGAIPADTGLLRPRLKVEVTLGAKDPVQILRIGDNAGDGLVCAATNTGLSGPAFLLPGPSWNELIRAGERFAPLPDDVFAPAE
jgi:hypothetical protein